MGHVVQTVFIFAAAMLLVLLMFSGTLRARLRVFLSKHFFSYRTLPKRAQLRPSRGGPASSCASAVEAPPGCRSPGGPWVQSTATSARQPRNWGTSMVPSRRLTFIQWLGANNVVDRNE
jgi:hypothetical protein